jgi:hypothetical protein
MKKKTQAKLRAQLARDLAAALANPEIPVFLYDGISSAITEFQSRCVDYNALLYSPETIEKALTMFAEKGGAR